MSEVLIAPARGRVQQLYRRWRARWADVVADSFNRIDAGKLGTSDTGHTWVEHGDFTPAAGTGYWQVLGRAAEVQPEASSSIQTFWAGIATPSADVRVSAVMQFSDTSAWGAGLFYRSLDGISGLFLSKTGVPGQYLFGSLDGTTQPAGLATIQTINGGPGWASGEWRRLEVRVSGATHLFLLDGVAFGSANYASNGGRVHGLFHYHAVNVSPFRRFKVLRYS